MEKTKTIRPMNLSPFVACVPGSKSHTHRVLIAAALASGSSRVANGLVCDDTDHTAHGLCRMGARITKDGSDFIVQGVNGRPGPCREPIDLGNSGTSMRLLTAVASLGTGTYTLTGTQRMKERPIGDLADALAALDVRITTQSPGGCPPVEVEGTVIGKSQTTVRCALSSQFLSGLLLIGPYTQNGLHITVSQGPVSRPYVDMTLAVMRDFGVDVQREGYVKFFVPSQRKYVPGLHQVEPDASSASYFWAAAAITGASVTVAGISPGSVQGDARFASVLEQMGCQVRQTEQGLCVTGGNLSGIRVNMADMPDMVPTLAVVAAYARGTTRITDVSHLKAKESDRLGCVAQELAKMGILAQAGEDGLVIEGGEPMAASIETHDDHRLAMSFAVAGLKAPGTVILDPGCVEKSFPGFWEEWERMTS